MSKEPKKRNPFNNENRDFRAILGITKTKEALACMEFIGCKSRPVFVEMCIHQFIKNNTPNAS